MLAPSRLRVGASRGGCGGRQPTVRPALSDRFGVPVLLKSEHMQTTGSFKLRGATNAVLALPAEARRRGLVTASSGNHGRALAHAAQAAGARAVICLSVLVPANKVEAIRALGADVRIVGRSQDAAQRRGRAGGARHGLTPSRPSTIRR